MKKKLLCPRNEVCMFFFFFHYISFLVSLTCRRLAPLSYAVSDDCICPWAFTHLHLPLFLLFIFFVFLKQSVAMQPGWPGTHDSPIPVSDSLCFFCPSSHVLGLITEIYSGLYLFLIIMMFFKKVLQFLQIPYQITQEEPDVQRDLKSCSGLYSQLVAVPRIFCWICRCMDH